MLVSLLMVIVASFSTSQLQRAASFVQTMRHTSATVRSLSITRQFSSLQSEKKGFGRTGDEKRIMPSSLYKKRKNPRNIAQQSRDRTRPKKIQTTPEVLKAPLLHAAMSCSCGSGLPYSKCCQLVHNWEREETPTPEAVLRARYTGYKHGITNYIIETTHPKNSDYDKYINLDFTREMKGGQKWSKDILRMACDHDYRGLKVLNSNVDEELGFATVTFQTLLKEVDGPYIATEEHSQFTKNRQGGRKDAWLYLDGETTDVSDEDFDKLFEEFGDPADLIDGADENEHNDDQEENSLSPAAQAAMVAIKESEKHTVRDKRGHRSRKAN